MHETPTTRSLLLLATLAVHASAQVSPTFDDVLVGNAPLDAGGTVPVRMDVYRPAGTTGPVPLVLWIHGGGWQSGDHNAPPSVALPLLQSGIAVATIDYRLSNEAIFPAQIEDVKGAVRHLRANAAAYGIDGARIACWGSSAGGHLSALLATSSGVAGCEGSTGGNLQFGSGVVAAVDYFGPTDIVQMNPDVTTPPGSNIDHDSPDSPESRLIGFDGPSQGIGVLRANLGNPVAPFPALAALAALANPITHVDPADPALFVAHGTVDTSVPIHQSERLVSALQSAAVDVTWRPATGAGHGALGAAVDAEARAFLVLHLSDCDGNGVLDAADVAAGNAADTDGDGVIDVCDNAGTGIPLCFGDGTGTACPCGNSVPVGAASGCRHSLGVGGRLRASGTPSISADTLVLLGSQMPDSSVLHFQGSTPVNGGVGGVFGDGLRCAGGAVVRLSITTNASGASVYPATGDPRISLRGGVLTPGVRWYQSWFRNAAAFCTPMTFNLTNAVRIDWSA
ncbi:MAG: alpha/beta hydrolase [Planctomycetota bacterium]|nr:alpha/beta hydrolase [Planctomycetota bacterium]